MKNTTHQIRAGMDADDGNVILAGNVEQAFYSALHGFDS